MLPPLHAELIDEEGALKVSYTLLHETDDARRRAHLQSPWCADQSGGGASAFVGGYDTTSSDCTSGGTAPPSAHQRGWWGGSSLSPQDPEGVAGISSFTLHSADADAQSSSLSPRDPEGVAGISSFTLHSADADAQSSSLSPQDPEGVAGISSFTLFSADPSEAGGTTVCDRNVTMRWRGGSFLSSQVPEEVAGGSSSTLFSADSSEAGGTTISIGAPMHGAFRQLGESPLTSSYSVDAAPYSFLLSVAQDGGGSYNELATFYDGGKSGGLGTAFGGVNYFHLPVTSLATVPYHICPPMRDHDVMVYGISDYSRHDVMTYFDVYANYNDSPMTTCDNSTIDGTVGHGGIAGFYAYRDIYDEDSRDDAAMKIYFSACNGHEHDYALLGYFCACSQNFGFTAGYGIYSYNLLGTALDDAVVDDSERKDPLNISTLFLLWTASTIMIAAFVLCLSTTTSTTIEVGMKDISTGLVEVFGMIRINLLEERDIFERKSGSATTTTERDTDCECEDAYPPIVPVHKGAQFYLIHEHKQASLARSSTVLTAHSDMGGMRMDVNRILYMTSFLLTCSSDDPLSRYVFQCLVRSSLDHRAESHRVCSAASVMTMYGQQSRVHTRACLSLS